MAYKAGFCWCCVVPHLQTVQKENSKPHKAAVAHNTAFNCGGPQTKEMKVLIQVLEGLIFQWLIVVNLSLLKLRK